MPSSTRRKLRDERRSFLGEDKSTAEAGVGRHDLGLDRCTPRQGRFRALLALHLFNTNTAVSPGHLYSARAFLSYSMTVSPRYDHLLFIIPPAVENARGRLMASRGNSRSGMPGLRLVAADDDYRVYHIIHLPTGARMTLARQADFLSEDVIKRRGAHMSRRLDMPGPLGLEAPLDPVERAALDALPSMTPEIQVLLAALVSRLDARDPNRQWAIGQWWQDPLSRPRRAGFSDDDWMSLWGEGAHWELRWCKHPRPEDIVACLNHPRIGIHGAIINEYRRGWKVSLGQSTLSLRYGATR